ncbi:MAG: hypothetical protein ACFNVU_09410, partial [Haemophilus seminalis]
PSALVKKQGHFAGHEFFEKGLITIQDESSQLVAPTLHIEGNEQILDACSAPGDISSNSTDAINGSQLYGVLSSLEKIVG